MPLIVELLLVALVGCALGAAVNWAICTFAWFTARPISPWSVKPEKAPPRKLSDRIPILGWLGLRREAKLHGRGFWIRPIVIELALGVGFAWLYWWEVDQQRLVLDQVRDWLGVAVLPPGIAASDGWVLATFCSHALVIALMAAASFIDIDEKIIPDEITVPGTLLGLLLATLAPASLLPHVDVRQTLPALGEPLELPNGVLQPGNTMYVEPVTSSAPNPWPEAAGGTRYLLVAQGCWWLWCFAIVPRYWRGRRGWWFALKLILRRIVREFTRFRPSPVYGRYGGMWSRVTLGMIAWPGALAVALVWLRGGAAWLGLFSSLVGLAGSGGIVWAVRKAGTAALGREAMGFGDVTLMMMVGTFLGWQSGIIAFFLAPLAGVVIGVVRLLTRSDDEIPYGPFLCLGALVVMVRWADVWNRTQFAFGAGWLVPVVLIGCVVLLWIMLAIWNEIKKRLFGSGEDE